MDTRKSKRLRRALQFIVEPGRLSKPEQLLASLMPGRVEGPGHYQERVCGLTETTKVFSTVLRMLRICWHAWCRLEG